LRVDVTQSEEVSLVEVFGRIPIRELVEVLNSDWAQHQGWSAVEEGRLYASPVDGEVGMEIEVDGQQARMRLRASATVRAVSQEAEQKRLREKLQGQTVRDQANLRCYQVVNQVYALAIPRRAEEMQYTVLGRDVVVDQQSRRVRVELRLRVPVG
jgi:hypothetical protein